MSRLVQIYVTARDRFGNNITTGDPGIQLVWDIDDEEVVYRDTFSRTVSGADTRFYFRGYRLGHYLWRFETPDGGLVWQTRSRIHQGWDQRNSYYVRMPSTLQAGETMFAGLVVADDFGAFLHMWQSVNMDHRVYDTDNTNMTSDDLRRTTFVIEVRLDDFPPVSFQTL